MSEREKIKHKRMEHYQRRIRQMGPGDGTVMIWRNIATCCGSHGDWPHLFFRSLPACLGLFFSQFPALALINQTVPFAAYADAERVLYMSSWFVSLVPIFWLTDPHIVYYVRLCLKHIKTYRISRVMLCGGVRSSKMMVR